MDEPLAAAFTAPEMRWGDEERGLQTGSAAEDTAWDQDVRIK